MGCFINVRKCNVVGDKPVDDDADKKSKDNFCYVYKKGALFFYRGFQSQSISCNKEIKPAVS